jgi:hypothetical protein
MTRVFIDTNILVYADQPHAPFHTIARNALIAFEQAGDEVWISNQVIREYLSVVTRPNPSMPDRPPLSPRVAVEAAERFLDTFHVAPAGQFGVTGIPTSPRGGASNHGTEGSRRKYRRDHDGVGHPTARDLQWTRFHHVRECDSGHRARLSFGSLTNGSIAVRCSSPRPN